MSEINVSNKIKHLHATQGNGLSLKAFARQCLTNDDSEVVAVAKQWFKNKSHSGQTPRSLANANLAKTIGAVVKQSRRAASSKK